MSLPSPPRLVPACGQNTAVEAKRCGTCKVEKPIDQFNNDRSQKDGKTRRCKACQRDVNLRWQQANPASRKHGRSTQLMIKYGLTPQRYNEMLEAQRGCCAICGVPEAESRGRNPGRLCVDHDHDTGVVRGLLCSPCNARLGKAADVAWLQSAMNYLKEGPR